MDIIEKIENKESKSDERKDGRKSNQMREISVEQSLLNRADGSAKLNLGDTSVIVAIYGPNEVKMKNEIVEKATIEVIFQASSGKNGKRELEYAFIIQEILEYCILTTLHPRTAIRVVIQVVKDSGSLLSVAINATTMALLDSGISMKSLPVSLTMAVNNETKTINHDPNLEEEKSSKTLLNIVYDSKFEGLLSSKTIGSTSESLFFKSLEEAQILGKQILSFFKLSIQKKFSRASLII
eukprot:TRINITY_DN7727_c0_g1_i1.p1 TRINITY_DN7727_c0_g1~~TRINITY_DN7727_c0_g1_i1.p1  ORF type:complete len:239 (-),score=44.84 TRINITY_DN7727_c0_g1_i1:26-742(-)